jgi:hypothetical protein
MAYTQIEQTAKISQTVECMDASTVKHNTQDDCNPTEIVFIESVLST